MGAGPAGLGSTGDAAAGEFDARGAALAARGLGAVGRRGGPGGWSGGAVVVGFAWDFGSGEHCDESGRGWWA